MASLSSSRRSFLQTTAGLAATGLYFPWSQTAFANHSPNDRPRFASIGIGGMGSGDARDHRRFADLVAICDVDSGHAARANADEKIGGGKADVYGEAGDARIHVATLLLTMMQVPGAVD